MLTRETQCSSPYSLGGSIPQVGSSGGYSSVTLNPAQSLQTENGQWKRSERAICTYCGGDLQEADHSTVSCVGLFGVDGGKDRYFCKSTCDSIIGNATGEYRE